MRIKTKIQSLKMNGLSRTFIGKIYLNEPRQESQNIRIETINQFFDH